MLACVFESLLISRFADLKNLVADSLADLNTST